MAGFIAATPVVAQPQLFEESRADGSAIHWTLDLPDAVEKVGLIVLAQGSGCLPAMQSRFLQQTPLSLGILP